MNLPAESMRLACTECSRPVSTAVPAHTVVNAWILCGACVERAIREGRIRDVAWHGGGEGGSLHVEPPAARRREGKS